LSSHSLITPAIKTHYIKCNNQFIIEEEEEEEEEEEPLLIYTTQGSPFRCKKLSVINGSPERNNVFNPNWH